MMFKKQSPQRKPRMVRGVDVCGHPVGCACIYCQDETKSRTNDNIVTQIINAVVGGGGWSKKAAEQDVKDILAPIEAELQRVYQANSANHELYLEADDKRKGAEKLVAGLREEIERLKREGGQFSEMAHSLRKIAEDKTKLVHGLGAQLDTASRELTELRAKLAEQREELAEHTKWVMRNAMKMNEIGVSTHGDGIWYNKRAEAAEAEAAALRERIGASRGKMLDLRIMLEEDGYTNSNIAMQALDESTKPLDEALSAAPERGKDGKS